MSQHAADVQWGLEPLMSDVEALMWRSETDPRLRSGGVIIDVLDRAPEWGRLVAAHEWAVNLVPRLRQRVVEDPVGFGAPGWSMDERFDLAYHLRRVRAPEPATFQEVLSLAQGMAMAPFDRARPLWEALLVEGLAGGGAAYLLKLHHSLMDGQGFVQLFDLLHSTTSEPTLVKLASTSEPPGPVSPRELLGLQLSAATSQAAGGVSRALGLVQDLVRRPEPTISSGVRFAQSLARVLGAAPAAPSTLMRSRGISRRFGAIAVPVESLRAAGKAAEGSLNDAFLAALVGGLRLYHEEHGAPVDVLPIAFPVSLRRGEDPVGGNRFAGARIAGPVGVTDPRERIRLIRERVIGARGEPALDFMGIMAPLLNRVPTALVTRLTERLMRTIDLQASNIPGLSRPAYIAGARILRMYPFGPAVGSAVMVTLASHDGMCCIGINADGAAIPDMDVFVACLRGGFDEVLAMADRSVSDADEMGLGKRRARS